MRGRVVIGVSAAVAALVRVPGLTWPLAPDEAGFLIVARHWEPRADSMYGDYWVDRPPLLIWLVKVADQVGGTVGLRLLAALGCALLVVAAAQTARLVAGDRAAPWTAVAVAAVTSSAWIDPVAAQGELLGIPLVVCSFWSALAALERRSAPVAALAGLLAALPLGLKQNLVSGLAFGGVLLVAAWATRRITRAEFVRYTAAALAGAAVPIAGTVAWAVGSGVRLEAVWYALYGFRGEALDVILDGPLDATARRGWVLLLVAFGCGMAFIIGGFLVHLRQEWAVDRVVTAATLAVVLVDGLGLVLSGSFWRPYLFTLVPATMLCAAMLAARASRRGTGMRWVIGAAALSAVASLVFGGLQTATGWDIHDETRAGTAVGEASEPGDTLFVYGGRAHILLASGLESPYPHLWNLTMRTLDPDLAELRATLAGPDAPTWIVEAVRFEVWPLEGLEELRALVASRYELVATDCDGREVYLLRGVDRPVPDVC